MRSRLILKLGNFLAIGLMCAATVYAQAPKANGIEPRAAADKYPAHTVRDGLGVGAALLTTEQVRKTFVANVNHCCVVVEVAIYPQKDGTLRVSLADFTLRVVGTDTTAKASSAQLVAGKLQKKDASASGHDVDVVPTSTIGYETGGIDPVTGRRRGGGVYTGTGVGVGIGGHKPSGPAADYERHNIEVELGEKGLPEGKTFEPVAGYLYFELPSKKDKKANYELEYQPNAEKVVLQLK